MTEPAAAITGIHHFSPTVRDVEASAAWYEKVFSAIRVPITFPHHDLEDTGYAVLLIEPGSGLLIGLHHHEANDGRTFDESRTGLDHIGFGVAVVAGLAAAWLYFGRTKDNHARLSIAPPSAGDAIVGGTF